MQAKKGPMTTLGNVWLSGIRKKFLSCSKASASAQALLEGTFNAASELLF